MKDFLVLGLMPFFATREHDITDSFTPEAPFREFIDGFRDYGKFQLRPLGLKRSDRDHVWEGTSMHLVGDGNAYTTASQAVYHLTLVDDALTEEDITDCLIGVQSVMYDFAAEEYTLVPFDPDDIPTTRVLPVEWAVEQYCRRFQIRRDFDEHAALIGTKHTRGSEWDARLWGSISCVAGDEQAAYALLFLRAALEHVMFVGEGFERALRFQQAKAQRIKEAVDIENSIHNCYKVMEAIYGGTLAKDWQQVEREFDQIGVHLQQVGGFQVYGSSHGVEPLIEKLKRLRFARDDRAAHGRIHANRRSTYYELMDYQTLASRALLDFLHHKYPGFPK